MRWLWSVAVVLGFSGTALARPDGAFSDAARRADQAQGKKVNADQRAALNTRYPGMKVYDSCVGDFSGDKSKDLAVAIINADTGLLAYALVIRERKTWRVVEVASVVMVNGTGEPFIKVMCLEPDDVKARNKALKDSKKDSGEITTKTKATTLCAPLLDHESTIECHTLGRKKDTIQNAGGWSL
jgi:hypothetical protein